MTSPLPRHHGIVKCPSYAYYRIRAEVVGHPGILAYCFSNTMNSDILLASHTVFHILYSREVCDFGRTESQLSSYSSSSVFWRVAFFVHIATYICCYAVMISYDQCFLFFLSLSSLFLTYPSIYIII